MTTTPNISKLPWVLYIKRKKLPEGAAIYFALNGKQELLYIGATERLRHRLRMHHRRHELKVIPGARIAWLFVDDLERLYEMEGRLIDELDPPMNRTPVLIPAGQRVMIGAHVSAEIQAAVATYAAHNGRTVSNMVQIILRDHPAIKAIMDGTEWR